MAADQFDSVKMHQILEVGSRLTVPIVRAKVINIAAYSTYNGLDCELVSLSDCKPDASGTVGSSPT